LGICVVAAGAGIGDDNRLPTSAMQIQSGLQNTNMSFDAGQDNLTTTLLSFQ
jgi:hypothetical protein